MSDVMSAALSNAVAAGDQIWDSLGAVEDFEFEALDYPWATATRRADHVRGTLTYTRSPRFYFGWKPVDLP